MDLIKLPKLDHSKKSIGDVFGLSTYDQHYVKSAVVFETLSSSILAKELFSDPSEAPDEMTTVSGILERAFAHVKTLEQQILLILEFQGGYMSIVSSMNEDTDPIKVPKELLDKDKLGIASTLAELMMKLKSLPLEHTKDIIKECNHNFDQFIERVLPRSRYDEAGNIPDSGSDPLDEMIKKALGSIPGMDIRFGSLDDTDDDSDDDDDDEKK